MPNSKDDRKKGHPGREGYRLSLDGLSFEEAVDRLLEASPTDEPDGRSTKSGDHQSDEEARRTSRRPKSSGD